MTRKMRGRPSYRDQLVTNDAWGSFYAASADKPHKPSTLLAKLPPKRHRVRRPVDGKPDHPSEYQEQGAVIDWWAMAHKTYGLPMFSLYSVPNGAYLASGYQGASMLKKTGMRNGAPDLVLDKPAGSYHGLRIEMKSMVGKETEEQRDFGRYLESVGYKFRFCYGALAAIEEIKVYLG